MDIHLFASLHGWRLHREVPLSRFEIISRVLELSQMAMHLRHRTYPDLVIRDPTADARYFSTTPQSLHIHSESSTEDFGI